MNRKALVSLVAAALMATSAALLADVVPHADGSVTVGRGDVLSLFFTGPHASDNFNAHAGEVSFSEEFTQSVEQDCVTAPEQSFVGVRTGHREAEVADVAYTLTWNGAHNNIVGFELAAPDSSVTWSDVIWDHPAGSDNQGCPNAGPEQNVHPQHSPRFGPIELGALWVEFNSEKVQIYP
jgi:hypothetical protein